MKNLAVYISIFIFFICGAFAVDLPIRTLDSIRNLSPIDAAKGLSVDLESQVIRLHLRNGLFLFDGTRGIYVEVSPKIQSTIKLGDIVRVRGRTSSGGFMPSVIANSIEVVGQRALPNARPFDSSELFSPDIDCDWVYVSGRLISLNRVKISEQMILIELEQDNLRYFIQMRYSPGTFNKLADKMFKMVSFNAVAGSLYNQQRQLCGRVFFVNDPDDFIPLEDQNDGVNQLIIPIHQLMRVGFNPDHPVRTSGIVTSISDREIIIRGEKSSLRASVLSTPLAQIGDLVILEGYVKPNPVSPEFRARSVVLQQVSIADPEPIPLKLKSELSSRLNMEFVSLEAELVKVNTFSPDQISFNPVKLLCRANGIYFEAVLPVGEFLRSSIDPGSKVKLIGIAHLEQNENEKWRVFPTQFSLQLRSALDVEVVGSPSWWTKKRLSALIGIIFGASSIFLLWAVVLKKTVKYQTRIISRQVEKEAVMEERQRIARELHDNLDQGVVGAALQLRSVIRLIDQNNLDGCRQIVNVARQMLEHCSQEARNSILDLRGGLLEHLNLPEAIQEALNSIREENQLDSKIADIKFSCSGEPIRLKLETERNVLLIAKESTFNAIRHANASEINVKLSFENAHLELSICDDGCGFNPNEGAINRFGVQGMYERASRLGGKITVESAVGNGTKISLILPTLENVIRS